MGKVWAQWKVLGMMKTSQGLEDCMLIERENELLVLNEKLADAENRRGGVTLITGDAGIGKTSLINTLLGELDEKFRVSLGMCDALYTPRPLGAVYEIALSLGGTCAAYAHNRRSADDIFPQLLSHFQSSTRPIACVVEDVHWADNSTLDFIRYLGRRIAALPVVLIITFRDNEVGADHPLTQVLGDLPSGGVTRISLGPLSVDGVSKLNKGTFFSTEDLVRMTGGNPFFVTELLASDTGDLTIAPGSVREAVNARLSRVSAEERTFLEAASLIPGSIHSAFLDTLFDGKADMLVSACIGRGLLKRERDGSIRFRHELARLATADRLSSLEQQSLHKSLLDVLLKSSMPPLDQIVHHAAGALNTDIVLQFAPRAAEEAAAIGAHREAAAHLATALEFVSEAPAELAAHLYEMWAYEAGLALGIDDEVIDARRHAITLWRTLGRNDKVGENLRWLSRLHWYRGEATKAARYSDDAVKLLEVEDASPEKALAYSLRSQMHMLNDRMPEAIEWGNKALEIAQKFGRDDIVVHALNNIGTAKIFRGNTSGVVDMNESLRLARELKRHEDVARVYTNLSEYAVEFRDFELAEKTLSEGIAFDTEHDLDSWTFYLIGRLAQLRLEQGRLEDAATIARGVLQRDDQTLLMKLPSKIVLAKALLRMGHAETRTHLSAALHAALSVGELQYIIPVRTSFVEYAALNGVSAETEEHLRILLRHTPDQVMQWRRAELWLWAHLCKFETSTPLFDDLPEPYQQIRDRAFTQAARAFDFIGMTYHSAYASMLSGDDGELIRAHKLAMDIHSKPLENKCRALAKERDLTKMLHRRSRGPYAASKSHPLGLTQKEQAVLRELATGASNQGIAEKLSRSRRTIENHVSSILHKLNASNRTDVILRIQNEPWLLP